MNKLLKSITAIAITLAVQGVATMPAGSAPLVPPEAVAASVQGNEASVLKVHGRHCATRYSPRRGWHRHWRSCDDWRYRHTYRRGCWVDRWGRWHCMNRRYHRHPRGCWFGPNGIYCRF